MHLVDTSRKITKVRENASEAKVPKGQLISKCLLGITVSTKKTNEFLLRISALASKKRSNQKINALYYTNYCN